jgi:hypothetical protein
LVARWHTCKSWFAGSLRERPYKSRLIFSPFPAPDVLGWHLFRDVRYAMNKLLKFKEWVTISEAVQHLSLMLGCIVSESDILQMALDGHLTLSVYLPNDIYAKIGSVVPYKNVEKVRSPLPDSETGKYYTIPMGHPLEHIETLTDDTPFICFDDEVTNICGVWDLSMRAGEKFDVDDNLQQIIGGPRVTMMNINGTFLNRLDGTWASPQKPCSEKNPDDGYYPCDLDQIDCIKIIRVSELMKFQNKIESGSEEKPLGDRERATLLNIIGALLALMLGKSPAGKSQSVFADQTAIIDAVLAHNPGISGLSERTLKGKFAAANASMKQG